MIPHLLRYFPLNHIVAALRQGVNAPSRLPVCSAATLVDIYSRQRQPLAMFEILMLGFAHD